MMASINKKAAGLAAAGVAVAAIGLGVAASAQADSPTPTPSPTSTTAVPGAGNGQGNAAGNGVGKGNGFGKGGRHGMGGFGGMGRFGLGGDVAALAQKLGIDETRLRTALGAVRDQLKTDKAKGSIAPQKGALSDDFANRLAQQLGISADKVKTAINDLRTAAEASRLQAFTTRLDQAVKDGKLTQAEADAVKKAAKAGVIGMGGGPR